jgi:hypothetical protein
MTNNWFSLVYATFHSHEKDLNEMHGFQDLRYKKKDVKVSKLVKVSLKELDALFLDIGMTG